MNTPSLGAFLLSLFNFAALGAIFGILYRALWSALVCIRSVPTGLLLCAKEGRISTPRTLFREAQNEKSMAGKILSEVLNFFLIIIFGTVFLGVWYLLTDATPRIIFPVACILFFFIAGRLFGKAFQRFGIFLAFMISLLPSFPVLIFSKIAKKVASRQKKQIKNKKI